MGKLTILDPPKPLNHILLEKTIPYILEAGERLVTVQDDPANYLIIKNRGKKILRFVSLYSNCITLKAYNKRGLDIARKIAEADERDVRVTNMEGRRC